MRQEPTGFDQNVRRRGAAYLKATPGHKNFKPGHDYWKWASNELFVAYGRICAYTCWYMPLIGTLDHYLPKSKYPELAYEWSNYRLALHRMNMNKSDSTEVVDPFAVQPGWFALDFPSCLVVPGPNIGAPIEAQVRKTIDILKLNIDDNLVQERCNLMVDFSKGYIALPFLRERYPFLAIEIERQNLQARAAEVFKTRN